MSGERCVRACFVSRTSRSHKQEKKRASFANALATSERLTCPVLFLELGSLHLRRLRVKLLQVAVMVAFVPGH